MKRVKMVFQTLREALEDLVTCNTCSHYYSLSMDKVCPFCGGTETHPRYLEVEVLSTEDGNHEHR